MFSGLTDIHKDWYLAYRKYEWALYHYLNGDYPLALSALDIAINNYGAELDVVLGNALLLKGKIYDILGDRKTAIKLYRDCIRLDNFTHAMENAEQYLVTSFVRERVD
jgi:tetratricopeptide (TPR) repeat protein